MPDGSKVGYRKPPKHSQFKKGQSGNPKGRPKGAKNLKTELMEELQEKIAIKEGGKGKTVSKQRAMIKSLAARAVQGNTQAAKVILDMVYRYLHDDDHTEETEALSETDLAILKDFEQEVALKAKEINPKIGDLVTVGTGNPRLAPSPACTEPFGTPARLSPRRATACTDGRTATPGSS